MEKNIVYRTWFYEGIRSFLLYEEFAGGKSVDDPEMNPENDPENNPENDPENIERRRAEGVAKESFRIHTG